MFMYIYTVILLQGYIHICYPPPATYHFTVVVHGAMVLLEYHHISWTNDGTCCKE